MIIGNNNNKKNSFINNYNSTQFNNNERNMNPLPQHHNIMNDNKTNMQHSNIMDKSEMNNKAFAMLQDRLNNGTISIEEFNKKCIELGKHSK